MKKFIIVLVAMTAALSACSNLTKEKLGLSNKAPNEFLVTTMPPLSLPPEYDLRPVVEPVQSQQENLPAADEAFVSEIEEAK